MPERFGLARRRVAVGRRVVLVRWPASTSTASPPVCDGFHDAADHHAVGQNIEVIVAPFVGQTAHVAAALGIALARTAARIAHHLSVRGTL